MRTRRTMGGLALALNLAAVAALGGCSGEERAGDVAAPLAGDRSEEVEPVDLPLTSAFTGQPLDAETSTRPVLVVKIDNTRSARPQRGVGAADLVVEELVEGGATRLAAFYQTSYPDEIGPIRSMRATDIGIVPEADDTLIVTSGAAQRTITRIVDAGLHYVEEGSVGFYRASGRVMPYNLFADLSTIADTVDGDGLRPEDYLPWGEHAAYAQGTAATGIDVVFSRDHTTSWSFEGGRYGIENSHAASDDEFVADTVVTLEVDVVDAGYRDPAGNAVPESVLEGSGDAVVFHEGRAVEATWSKASLSAPIQLTTADGAALTVPPGRTWIELVPTTGTVDYR